MNIETEFDNFFEFDTTNRQQVTSTSCKIFAEFMAHKAVEEFKAGLVPVAYEFKGRYFDPDQIADESLCTKLYELRETK
jgi:hypothetical protein